MEPMATFEKLSGLAFSVEVIDVDSVSEHDERGIGAWCEIHHGHNRCTGVRGTHANVMAKLEAASEKAAPDVTFPLYYRIQKGEVVRTREILPGILNFDYDKNSQVLAVEVLAADEKASQ